MYITQLAAGLLFNEFVWLKNILVKRRVLICFPPSIHWLMGIDTKRMKEIVEWRRQTNFGEKRIGIPSLGPFSLSQWLSLTSINYKHFTETIRMLQLPLYQFIVFIWKKTFKFLKRFFDEMNDKLKLSYWVVLVCTSVSMQGLLGQSTNHFLVQLWKVTFRKIMSRSNGQSFNQGRVHMTK